ncbi:hypothetical protein EP7_003315 [Isosphaeraceae bacterium EP7]
MPINARLILDAVMEEYVMSPGGIHGVSHWARVWENGLRLATETGADVEVVKAFALIHDSKRWNDDDDPGHGPRAAVFARTLRGRGLELGEETFELLFVACRDHTSGRTHPDPTVQTCWDADRLDLGRVGICPEPAFLCTEAASRAVMIDWANGRSEACEMPDWVADAWGIEIEGAD